MDGDWYEVEGLIIGFLHQTDDSDDSLLVVRVNRWRFVTNGFWLDPKTALPVCVLRSATNDHEVVVRGDGWTEESSPGLGDTIRFTTNREEQELEAQWN
jgi:hypothetical protein